VLLPSELGQVTDDVERVLSGSPYRCVRLIGRGGMGQVYEIEHSFLGRRLALKVLHPIFASNPEFTERLRLEAHALARLRHPAIVDIVDFWTTDEGQPCVVMELLHGRSLHGELRERKRLPLDEAVEIALQALSGLRAAHAMGIVHRDIKPENLFVHEIAGKKRILKILDFGLARLMPQLASDTARAFAVSTQTGAVVGSPRFMSPEAARGERVDARGDLYSLGLVLYLMLSGRAPHDFDATSPEPEPLLGEPGISTELNQIVLRAIANDITVRYQTAEEFRSELVLQQPKRKRRPT
jgi:serine/threonine-protein kinase